MEEKKEKKTKEEFFGAEELVEKLRDMAVEHRKIVLPVVLLVAILITMGIGISANRKKQQQEEVQANAAGQAETVGDALAVPDASLEENAYPEINELIMKYYKALEEANPDALTEIVSPLTDSVMIRFTEWAKHIEACPSVNIYTKQGPRENSYIAYVVADIQIVGYSETVPGLTSFFVCKNEAGNYYINMEEEIDKAEADYITALNLQDDVVDLSNKVSANFNQLVQKGSEAAQAFIKVESSITKGIQEALLAQQAAAQPEETAAQGSGAEQPGMVATKVKTTDVVNMRSSDSEKADKLGKAQIGDTFNVLEQRANGWTKLTDGTKEFFIKSEYLEVIEQAPAPAATEVQEPTQQPEASEAPAVNAASNNADSNNASTESAGYVTAKTTVNIRKEPSETAEKLGKIRQGDKLELITKQADGWSKVKYKEQTAYVKSEFVE